jgi:flagellar assembly protein FliH
MSDIKTTELIDELLQREDPALVGVKKILRKRRGAVSEDSSFHTHAPEVFNAETPEKSVENTTIFTDEQKQVVELERKIMELQEQLDGKEEEKRLAAEEAYSAGIEEGRRVQEEVAQEQLKQELQEMNSAADSALIELLQRDLNARNDYFESLTEDLITLTFSVAKQVILREVQQDRSVVERVVRGALFYIADKRGVEIRVNPVDQERVQEMVSAFQSDGERFISVAVSSDATITEGGCVIETASGIVDAQLERQLAEVEAEVARTWREMTAEEEPQFGATEL